MFKFIFSLFIAALVAMTVNLFVSQNTSANILDYEAVPFYGNVRDANGSCAPINGTTTVYLTGQGLNLHTTMWRYFTLLLFIRRTTV